MAAYDLKLFNPLHQRCPFIGQGDGDGKIWGGETAGWIKVDKEDLKEESNKIFGAIVNERGEKIVGRFSPVQMFNDCYFDLTAKLLTVLERLEKLNG